MDCGDFQKRLEDYLDNRMDFPGRFAVERHAGQCVHCSMALADARKLGRMARELNKVKAPPGFESSVMNEIAVRKLRRRSPVFLRFPQPGFAMASWRGYAVALSCLIVLGLGFFYWAVPDAGRLSRMRGPAPEIQSDPFDTGMVAGYWNPVPVSPTGYRAALPEVRVEEAEEGLPVRFQTTESDYDEYTAIGPDDLPMIVPLPKTIRMQIGLPSEEFFLTNVSH